MNRAIFAATWRSTGSRGVLPSKKDVFLSRSRYREEFAKVISERFSPEILQNDPNPEPQPVAEAVSQALFSEAPKTRYVVGGGNGAGLKTIDKILETLCQVNQGLTGSYHSLGREELVERLTKFINQ